MINTASDAIEFIKTQLHKPMGFFSFGKKREATIAQEILRSLDANPLTRWAFIQALRAEFLQKNITVEQFSALKEPLDKSFVESCCQFLQILDFSNTLTFCMLAAFSKIFVFEKLISNLRQSTYPEAP